MLALITTRDGQLPTGGDEVAAECGGRVVLIGSGAREAAAALAGIAAEARVIEAAAFQPARWAAALKNVLADEPIVVLSASADGRDLAPRLAHAMGRPLLAGAMTITTSHVELIRGGGSHLVAMTPPERFVATLQPGLRGVQRRPDLSGGPTITELALEEVAQSDAAPDPTVVDVLDADVATIDLGEAKRIIGGGGGMDGAGRFAQLATLGGLLGASVGATRVITDRGWVGHERQIGTTGVVVEPQLYLAFGVSGAVQHTSGLGTPTHVISVNTDPHCPMMRLSDLAVVADANLVLDELLTRLHAGATVPSVERSGG